MNLAKLKQVETEFLEKYPGGFTHPYLLAIGKTIDEARRLINQWRHSLQHSPAA